MEKLKNEFAKIEGRIIKKVIPGSLNSSIIKLVIENTESETISLMIHCCWRLSQGNCVLTGWNDKYDSVDTNYCKQLSNIIGQTITSVTVTNLCDIIMKIDDKVLYVFSDLYSTDEQYEFENWTLCVPNRNLCYSASNDNSVVEGSYE
jgi:hypothetical protein